MADFPGSANLDDLDALADILPAKKFHNLEFIANASHFGHEISAQESMELEIGKLKPMPKIEMQYMV